MPHLLADCLSEILKYLEDDRINLYSCLLVNRLWCEFSVRILWKSIWNYNNKTYNTLISCLPNESKEILYENGIVISTSTSKPPMFNYAAFCKILSINQINYQVGLLLKNQQPIIISSRNLNKDQQPIISSKNLNKNVQILVQEILKLYMNQITFLKELSFLQLTNITFYRYLGAKDCLKNLTKLYCRSDINTEFFCQLSKICNNIQYLTIDFKKTIISNGLTELISGQQKLKCLDIILSYGSSKTSKDLTDIISLLTKLPDTLNKLILDGGIHFIPLSFITKFTNLQELLLLFYSNKTFEDFKILQYVTFSKLQILKIQYASPNYELLINFLEINGSNLKEFYIGDIIGESNDSLNLAIGKYCSNLIKLSTGFKNDELETLKVVFVGCQNLESIKIWVGDLFLDEKKALEMIMKYSPKNVYELKLNYLDCTKSKLLPEELESFFINWENRISQKSISLMIINNGIDANEVNVESMKIIEKYIELGVIRKFKVTGFYDETF
ncbi:hypothetical protein RclHR1_03820004 [Rhizophagus clarus]|uniref:F-box domain-containing protein n=1 Tax=Rhizophagus clarus TaxID=94130 RepID=A0A2Z6S7W8_9GLOM|nr:hypothetical protein RclHR1_03820004 [Rhizophagus clarus]GET01636.1 hypothetical protein GLOIN_2v1784405 [Rhizophagus clarus]